MMTSRMNVSSWLTAALLPALCLACTQQQPNSFRLEQQLESFAVASEVNTKVDLLFVIDNSASMDVSQDKLRRGFGSFAAKYLRPNWDIRVAAITSDVYLANPAFRDYLRTTISGTNGWTSAYLESRISSYVNPPWSPNLVDGSGTFKHGLTWGEQNPTWGPDYARLLPGVHDGPIVAFCSELHSYFFYADSQCRVRDNAGANTGPLRCLAPGPGESAITQCVNTVQNDTVHSGRPILSTQTGSATIVGDFMINASVGTSGVGSERGLQSVLQFLADNETSATAFFRPQSQRVIVFLSDEDDQSVVIPSRAPKGFGPFTGYTASCPSKTVDGYTYRLSSCPESGTLMDVADVKRQLDDFYVRLDGGATEGKYLVIPIVARTGASIRALQQLRKAGDQAAGNPDDVAVDRGDRFLKLAELVGKGSFSLDIDADDYSTILDQIGRAIVQRKSDFELSRPPTGTEDMIVSIRHEDGSTEVVRPGTYSVTDRTLTLNDMEFVLGLSSTDRILVNYQPKTVY